MVWLLQGVAFACVCPSNTPAPSMVTASESSFVSAGHHTIVEFRGSNVHPLEPVEGLHLLDEAGAPVATHVSWSGVEGAQWARLVPTAALRAGKRYTIHSHAHPNIGQFRVSARGSAPVGDVKLLSVEYDSDSPGRHYGPAPYAMYRFSCSSANPVALLRFTASARSSFHEVQYAVSARFAEPQSVFVGPQDDVIAVGGGVCQQSNANLQLGRRTFFRVRGVASDGEPGSWSEAGSIEVGNYDSSWPPYNPPPSPPPIGLTEYAIRTGISAAAMLLVLMAWVVIIVWRRHVRRMDAWNARNSPHH